jgi:hypothetical protein
MCQIACLIVVYDTECLLQLMSFASSFVFWTLSFCVHRIGQIVKSVDMLFVTFNRIPVIRYLPLRVTPIFSNKTHALNT